MLNCQNYCDSYYFWVTKYPRRVAWHKKKEPFAQQRMEEADDDHGEWGMNCSQREEEQVL